MRFTKYLLFVILIISCEKLFIEKDPANDPESNFEILWDTFDRHYALFVIKNIDWDSLYNVYRPQVSQNTTPQQLYNILFNMMLELEDSHVDIYPDFDAPSGYDQLEGYPENSPENADNYLSNIQRTDKFLYGNITGSELGYIRIFDFEGDVNPFNPDEENEDFKRIDEILIELQDKEGLVIDVRSNEGGNDFNSMVVAGRFANERQVFEYINWRNGEEYDNVISKERYIEPKGEIIYTKPIAVLINRGTHSAAEGFIDMMKLFPQVTLIGGNTGGGFGGGSFFELPNGWTYRLTTSYSLDAEGNYFGSIGISPDIEVTISEADAANEIDTILEEAITQLNNP